MNKYVHKQNKFLKILSIKFIYLGGDIRIRRIPIDIWVVAKMAISRVAKSSTTVLAPAFVRQYASQSIVTCQILIILIWTVPVWNTVFTILALPTNFTNTTVCRGDARRDLKSVLQMKHFRQTISILQCHNILHCNQNKITQIEIQFTYICLTSSMFTTINYIATRVST